VTRVSERHDVCRTDTQYVVQLSGYAWALTQVDPTGATILDVASGTGFGGDLLIERARFVVGVDVSREAVAEARRRFRRPNLCFFQADGAALAFRNGAFDLVVSQDTIEHVEDDRRFVGEVARVLKPGGVFIVFTPWRREHTEKPENQFHLREYSVGTLRALLAAHFAEIRLWGRRWGRELSRTERELDLVRRFDPLGLRALIPRAVRHRVGNLWLRTRRAKPLDRITVEDVEYLEGAPPGSTTLIAVCRAKA
jgi:SAM-dependent methyltransferase